MANSYVKIANYRTMLPKKILTIVRNSYFPIIFVLIALAVGVIVLYKIVYTKPQFVYVNVKMGQGMWWAATFKPNSWLVNSVKKGEKQYNLAGKPTAEIVDVRYYPAWTPNWGPGQYDVYLTLKLDASYNASTQTYSFNRSSLSISSPVEIQFPSVDITGTVVGLSKEPFHEQYVEKTIYLIYQGGYTKDFPYRFDNIRVGDSYFDGEDTVFRVEDKWLEKNILAVPNNLNAEVYERPIEATQNIVVKAKVKLKQVDGALYFGNDYKVQANAFIPFATPNYFFENFVVRKVE